ncbi:MAG TPA: hypothetical protein VIX82_15575, partial [Solirubrobacteraceae bacterium]
MWLLRRHDRAGQRQERRLLRVLGATKGACDKTLVRRTLAEKVILDAVKDELADAKQVAYILHRVEEEVAKLRSNLPETL